MSSSKLDHRKNRHDRYYRKAKEEGFAARSVYKLQELNRRFRILKPGQRVLDLGCRPGSWLQYASEQVGDKGHVVGLDRQGLDHPPKNATIVVGDVRQIDPSELTFALPEDKTGCFHVILSDMAPDTTGIAFTDQARSIELFLRALEIASLLGCPKSSFVGKVFMGEGFDDALTQARQLFGKTKMVKPNATRKSSKEQYLVASGKK